MIDDTDVLVIGGGIHGAGAAQAAAAAGYQVTLIESMAFASGTSSRSSKLIHGGLRYLEQGSFRLVRESLAERELLLRLAPELVHRVPFFLPVYPTSRRRPWKLRAGLTAYALLAGLKRTTGFRSVPHRDWDRLDGLVTDQLRHVFQYWDAQTDDRALTLSVVASAKALNAEVLCPAEFVQGELTAQGCVAQIRWAGREFTLRARVVINAAGPWANQVLARFAPQLEPCAVENVQGSHLELPGELHCGCYYLEVPSDGRAVFVMPWKGHTLLGTTEQIYQGDPRLVAPLPSEIDYLLAAYRQFFPQREREVLQAWAGLRVLPAGGTAFRRTRETQLIPDRPERPRLISIFGGKLTGYRVTATKVLHLLQPTLPPAQSRGSTSELRLTPVSDPDLLVRPIPGSY